MKQNKLFISYKVFLIKKPWGIDVKSFFFWSRMWGTEIMPPSQNLKVLYEY